MTKATIYMDIDWKDEELCMSDAVSDISERVMERRHNDVYYVGRMRSIVSIMDNFVRECDFSAQKSKLHGF